MTESKQWLARHSAHDFDEVLRRWRALIEPGCLIESTLSHQDGYPIIAYRTRRMPTRSKGLYLSAGIHGDEPAGVWGLLEWAEANFEFLRESAAVIFPCFNPAGLVNNTRHDADGRDLNRLFQDCHHSLIKAWQALVEGMEFRIALMLHEDYDARGLYVYELTRPGISLADAIFNECESIIPREPRLLIEDNEFDRGIMQRTEIVIEELERQLDGGYPEAVYLYLKQADFSLTFETPSEFSLWDRVRAQRQFIESALRISAEAAEKANP